MPTRLHQSGSGSSRIPSGAVQLYDDIEEIKARKGSQSYWPKKYFRHRFTKRGSKIYGLNNGQLLITGSRPLWDKFSYSDSVGKNKNREENSMRHRRRGIRINPWFGDSGGHRLAALMRHGLLRRSKIKRHRKRHRGRPRLHYKIRVKHRRKYHRKVGRPRKHRKVVKHRRKHRVKHRRHYRRHRRTIDRRTSSYKSMLKRQQREAASYLGMYGTRSRAYRKVAKKYHFGNAPRRRYRMARHRRRHRKSYGSNPFSMPSFGGYDLKKGIEPALVIGSSIMMASVAVGYLQSRGWITLDAAWKRYGVQIGAGVAGAMILNKVAHKPEWAKYWGLGSLVAVAADLLATYVLPSINSALNPATATTGTAGFRGTRGVGAFPPNMRGMRGLGAFPANQQGYDSSPYEKSTQYITPY